MKKSLTEQEYKDLSRSEVDRVAIAVANEVSENVVYAYANPGVHSKTAQGNFARPISLKKLDEQAFDCFIADVNSLGYRCCQVIPANKNVLLVQSNNLQDIVNFFTALRNTLENIKSNKGQQQWTPPSSSIKNAVLKSVGRKKKSEEIKLCEDLSRLLSDEGMEPYKYHLSEPGDNFNAHLIQAKRNPTEALKALMPHVNGVKTGIDRMKKYPTIPAGERILVESAHELEGKLIRSREAIEKEIEKLQSMYPTSLSETQEPRAALEWLNDIIPLLEHDKIKREIEAFQAAQPPSGRDRLS